MNTGDAPARSTAAPATPVTGRLDTLQIDPAPAGPHPPATPCGAGQRTVGTLARTYAAQLASKLAGASPVAVAICWSYSLGLA